MLLLFSIFLYLSYIILNYFFFSNYDELFDEINIIFFYFKCKLNKVSKSIIIYQDTKDSFIDCAYSEVRILAITFDA